MEKPQFLAVAAGVLLAPPAAALIALAFVVRASWSGWAYALGTAMIAAGLLRRARLARAGGAVVALAALVHLVTASRGAHVAMTTTGGGGARLAGRVVDEGDGAVLGAHLVRALGVVHDPDLPEVPDALRDAYAEMRAAEGDTPSPVVPTYAGLEDPARADVVVVEPPRAREAKGALVFLHGWGGSFALPCWQIAQAAAEAGLVTYCPSVGPRGDWWSASGERTVRATLAMARARGLDRAWLAGLSNGGIGASLLAARMPGAFRGVILVSGVAPDAPAPGVPALVVQGERDAMCSASVARAYAARTGARYASLDAGHFALLLRRGAAHRAIADFLRRT